MSTLQNTDLFAVRRGANTYKVSYADILAGVKLPAALEYKGAANPAQPVPAPAGGLKAGMVYALTPGGVIHASWTGVAGLTAADGQLAVWEGAKWELMGVNNIVQPSASESQQGIVELATAAETTAGTDNTRAVHPAGLKVELDKKASKTEMTAAINAAVQPGSATPPATPTTGQTYIDTSVSPSVVKVWDGTAWVPQAGTVVTSATAPATPVAGQVWIDNSASPAVTKIWNGTAWVPMTVDSATQAKLDAQATAVWKRSGTVVSPTTAGDITAFSAGTAALPGLTPVGDPNTGVYAAGPDQLGLAANGVGQLLAGTNGITLPYLAGAAAGNVIVNATGLLTRQALPFTWDANDDSYVTTPVADRSILTQARMKRCLVTDAGVVTYLDADNSANLAGDWVRLVETSLLNTPYTGTHQAEQANTELRAMAPAWAAGTFTKGALVTNGGFVWECVAATTTATPAAGATPATLDGTAGQVMVEIPLFSVRHVALQAGAYKRHECAVVPGAVTTGGYQVHPAFVKPDGTYRNFIYVGAYQGTGANGNGSASGVNNTVSMTRAACRTACSGRGAGWHQLGYWENNALQWLLITEYQDFNSQRALGNGSMTSNVYVVPTGASNVRGNRSANVHTPAGANTDYVSYRGVENFYGRAWQLIDGINVNERNVYLSNDPSKWADNTATAYVSAGTVPSGSGSYQRDVMSGVALLPSSVAGASDTTFTGDALWTSSGWRVAYAGGSADNGGPVGALCVLLNNGSSSAHASSSGRLSYAA